MVHGQRRAFKEAKEEEITESLNRVQLFFVNKLSSPLVLPAQYIRTFVEAYLVIHRILSSMQGGLVFGIPPRFSHCQFQPRFYVWHDTNRVLADYKLASKAMLFTYESKSIAAKLSLTRQTESYQV